MSFPVRRTQEERSAETKARLLDATVACLLELGYDGTTTAAVQARAGLSRGALMHHYASKADLLVAAVRHLSAQRSQNLRTKAAEMADDDDRIGQAIDMLWETMSGPLFTATLELWSASRTDPELHRAVLESERSLRVDLEVTMALLFGEKVSASPAFGDALELTFQFLRGAAVTSILRTDTNRQQAVVDRWKQVFSVILEQGRAS